MVSKLIRTWERGSGETYSCEFENFGSQVLKHGSHIHGRLGADAHLVLCVLLEETLDTTTWELCEPGLAGCVEHWCGGAGNDGDAKASSFSPSSRKEQRQTDAGQKTRRRGTLSGNPRCAKLEARCASIGRRWKER
jgi:hypothetical protein